LLDRLIDQFHDPVVGVRGESIALLGIEPAKRVGERLDPGRLQFIVAKSVSAFDDARSNQTQRRTKKLGFRLLTSVTLAKQSTALDRIRFAPLK
jgi:DNA helicase HerA-like ATPase